jgi:hypothetical protein
MFDVASDIQIIAVEVQKCWCGGIVCPQPPAINGHGLAPNHWQPYFLVLQLKIAGGSLHIPAWEEDELSLLRPQIPTRAAIPGDQQGRDTQQN